MLKTFLEALYVKLSGYQLEFVGSHNETSEVFKWAIEKGYTDRKHYSLHPFMNEGFVILRFPTPELRTMFVLSQKDGPVMRIKKTRYDWMVQ